MFALMNRRSVILMLVPIVVSASASSLQAQHMAPVGAHAALTRTTAQASGTVRQSAIFGDTTQSMVRTGHSRQYHVITGLLAGAAIGWAAGAVVGNQTAKRCHAESCQVQTALGGLADMVVGGVLGATAGGIGGAAWPVDH